MKSFITEFEFKKGSFFGKLFPGKEKYSIKHTFEHPTNEYKTVVLQTFFKRMVRYRIYSNLPIFTEKSAEGYVNTIEMGLF